MGPTVTMKHGLIKILHLGPKTSWTPRRPPALLAGAHMCTRKPEDLNGPGVM